MKHLVLASGNAGKLAELQHGLARTGFSVVSHPIPEVDETASTFVENALLKARAAAAQTGLPAIADDSGLVVPALMGQPGIHSARFAGTPQNATANIAKLLTLLQDTPAHARHAWFHCSLVWLASADDPAPIICEGQWHGSILTAPSGHGGFGYDPIFYVPNVQMSAAELSPAEKNRVSHRGIALKNLVRTLKKQISYHHNP